MWGFKNFNMYIEYKHLFYVIVTGLISRIRGTLSARANRTEGTTWKNLMMTTFEIFASLNNLQAHVEGEAFIFALFFFGNFKKNLYEVTICKQFENIGKFMRIFKQFENIGNLMRIFKQF